MKIINRMHGHRSTYTQVQGLLDLILMLPEEICDFPMVEIGTFSGDAAVLFALKFFSVIAVDPIGNTEDFINTAGLSAEAIMGQFVRNTEGKNISLIRKKSDDAIIDFQDNSLGCVYVDGFHSYEQCRRDILNYWEKIVPNGYMCGHDFMNEDTLGATRAIQELFGEPDFSFIDWSWAVKKIDGRIIR